MSNENKSECQPGTCDGGGQGMMGRKECQFGQKSTAMQPTSSVPLDKTVIRKDLDKFKVDVINCAGWIVPPPIEAALKELCKKHNDLIEYLSLDV